MGNYMCKFAFIFTDASSLFSLRERGRNDPEREIDRWMMQCDACYVMRDALFRSTLRFAFVCVCGASGERSHG